MKKSTYVLSALFLSGALLLSACTEDNAAAPTTGQTAASENAPTAAAGGLTEPIKASALSKLPTAAKERTDTVIVGLTDPSGSFTPYFAQSGYDGNVTSLLFAPLVRVNKEGLPNADLAEKYEVSDDQLTYTFHLRPDSKFSDGSPLTADDVAFTWTLLHDKSYDGDFDITEAHVKGGEAYKEGKASSIEGIKVIDPQTISATLEKPNATALLLLGSDVLSKAYYGKDYKFGQLDYIKNLHSNPLGNGAYKLEKFIPGQEVRFAANEYYYKGKPKLEHFIYKTTDGDTWQFLETGEQDYASFPATTDNIEKLKNLGFVNLTPYTASNYGYLRLNFEHEAIQDKKVRQALTYGLDRQTIYVDSNQGAATVANIPTSPISWTYTEEGINPYQYDPEKANQLLDEAGWTMGADGIREKDGKPLTIHFIGSKKQATDIFIAVASENYKAIGVKFEPEQFADFNSQLAKLESGDYDMAAFSTSLMTDPADGVRDFVSGEISGYDNPEVKKLYEQGLATSDMEERKKIYHELYKVVNDDLPYIFTSNNKMVVATNGRLEGLVINPFWGISTSLPNWTLK
ncbi:ABC transporter substrate-binding protein [Paenibacillus medicaginis]|uniref:ABC transporter substrate-binding protein n=1 Tax=Paenibacillus medicaginis TaxID=1470560 RepID=A0ABV5BYX3_9BACL